MVLRITLLINKTSAYSRSTIFCTCVVFPRYFSIALLFGGRIKFHYFPEGCNILRGKVFSLYWTFVLLMHE